MKVFSRIFYVMLFPIPSQYSKVLMYLAHAKEYSTVCINCCENTTGQTGEPRWKTQFSLDYNWEVLKEEGITLELTCGVKGSVDLHRSSL